MNNICSKWSSAVSSSGGLRGSATYHRPVIAALLLLLLLLSGCSSVRPVVKVGLVAPFEGRYRPIGYDAIYAARLAIREINASGGIDGTMVELVALDDSGDLELARQAAASLVLDPQVVAVVGHWLPQTTEAADAVYMEGNLPLLPAGTGLFSGVDPATLPASFLDAYAAVTPFDEEAGFYAGPAYDALNLIFEGLELAKMTGEIDRASVAGAIEGLQYEGLTGTVYWP